jgi:hypothetical protein
MLALMVGAINIIASDTGCGDPCIENSSRVTTQDSSPLPSHHYKPVRYESSRTFSKVRQTWGAGFSLPGLGVSPIGADLRKDEVKKERGKGGKREPDVRT